MDGNSSEVAALSRKVVKIHAGVMALVCAVLGGGGLFLMTAWLLIKGGPNVGQHLRLLGHYFVGYSVTWTGSFVGFIYGAIVGGLIGWTVGTIYNSIATYRQR
jgi:hypothetical protein